jgi:hypothetical protein
MTQNQYDYIIIGAGQKGLTLNPSLKGEGTCGAKTKPSFYQRGLMVIDHAGTAMYSA